ncbi:MAG TPA: hypothetical protein PLQ68_10370 [Clostridia bacterium]|nr:hypothetical protein [Clostridia bacterium]HXK73099.1 hypothetical protein [Clostridia bacterium]
MMEQQKNPKDPEQKKEKTNLIKRILNSEDMENTDDSDYQSLLRKNFYNFDQVRKNRQLKSLRITTIILTVMLIFFLSLYLVKLNDSTMLLDRVINASLKYVYDNVLYVDNQVIYTEVVSELNVMRTLMNHNGETGKRQFVISELYYIAVQLPDSFVSYRSEVYDAFKNLHEGRLDIGYRLLEELLMKIVQERK